MPPCVCVCQIEDIRSSIDKIDESVTEIKKLYSTILSAPTSDQSNADNVFKCAACDSQCVCVTLHFHLLQKHRMMSRLSPMRLKSRPTMQETN